MKFKDLLNLNREAMLPSMDRVQKQVLKRRARLAKIAIAGSSVCAAAVIVVLAFSLFGGKDVVEEPPVTTGAINIIQSVSATSQSELGMKVDSSLKIETSEDVSANELKARLAVSPAADYSVRKTGACAYELKFSDNLEENAVYNVEAVYNGKVVYRWAFQTESVFSVTAVYPQNESYVATDAAIEVTFSHADVTGFEEAFQITPKLEGTFEHYGRTWAFVPTTPMEAATLYTVTIQKGIKGPDDLDLAEDHSFSFTTAPQGAYAYLIYQQNEAADTFLADETPIAAICYDQIEVSAASVKVYRLADSAAYIDAYKKYVRNGEVSAEITAEAGEAYLQFDVTPALSANYNGVYDKAAFINYPEPLPLGYYFAEIQLGGRKMYQLLQSTTLAVYTVTTNGDYTVWVNDTKTGEPVTDAKISLDGFKERKIGEQGIATFSDAEEPCDQRFLVVENGEYPYVAVLNGDGVDEDVAAQNDYYFYISTNSNLYKPTDTVRVFGMLLPRKADAKIPSEVVLHCDLNDQDHTVEVSKNGSFEAEIPLNNTAASYGAIQLTVKGAQLTGTYFNIADYELPDYAVTVSTDKAAYAAGETITVTAQATYMDGTPAAGVALSAENDAISGVTDENGCLSASVMAELFEESYLTNANYPEVHSLVFSIDDGTDYYAGSAEYLVFASDYYLKSSYADGKLTVEANSVDLNLADQIDRDRIYEAAYEEASFKGVDASVKLIGELHEVTYDKIPNGTSYDAINKRVVYAWQYEEKDQLIRTFEMSVVDGIGTVMLPEKPDENRNYYVVLRVAEETDTGTVKTYLTDYNYTGNNQHSYNLVADKTTVDINESVELLVRTGSNNEAVNSGSVLYTAVAGEIINHFYSSSARYTLRFKEEYAPDVLIYGAYFDGRHIYSLGYEELFYDLEQSELLIQMEKDQQQYQPGDEVTLKFKVTDRDGRPVSAVLNLSVLDRALYLLNSDFADPLYELYGSRCFGTEVYTTCSHREFMRGDQLIGEGGGGGGEYRGNFEDTPYFKTVETDADGEATVTFTLPDTITEWKVIARAVSEDVQAGMESFSLRSTQDFFAQVSMEEAVKSADDLTVAVKGEGLKAAAGAACTFRVGITDRDGNEIKTLTAEAAKSQYAYLNFGKLEVGLYTVYIQAECGDLQDSVIKTVTVQEAQGNVWIHHQQALEGALTLNLVPRRGNVTLTVVDEQQAFWQNAMVRLRNSAGTRVDQVLGQYLADQFYSTGVWMEEGKLDHSVIRQYLSYNGVLLYTADEDADLRVSAKMAAVVPDFCDKENMKLLFEQYLNNRYAARIDVLISYFGLAALGEPVLSDLQVLYSTQTELAPEEAVYLALAFAYSGDYDTARYIFDSQLKICLTTEGDLVYAMQNDGIDEDLTGCCALLSNRLSLEYCEGLINFIIETDTQYTLLNLELISYLNDHVAEVAGENTVNISTGDGRNESYNYQKMDSLVLELSPEQAADIRIMNVSGKSVVSYAYNGGIDALRQIGEERSMGAEIPTEVSIGEHTVITLHVEIPEDFELPALDLILPAGLQFEGGTVTAGEAVYSIENAYNSDEIHAPLFSGNNVIELQVRGALPGSYELEPFVITNAADSSFMATDAVTVTVLQENA